VAQPNGTVAFQSVASGLYVAADLNLSPAGTLVANRAAASTWEQFTVSGGSAPPGGGALVWSDEFDGPNNSQPNPANWSFLTGNGFDGAGFTGRGNGEWEWYRPENCFVRDGRLILRAEWLTSPMVIGGRQWFQTSCRITTRGKRSWQYGAIEARIAMPSRIGTWPAFWAMGDQSDGTLTTAYHPAFDYFDRMGTRWPSSGEIDLPPHPQPGAGRLLPGRTAQHGRLPDGDAGRLRPRVRSVAFSRNRRGRCRRR
jgi:beta-glucanase (GH16 family)